MGTAHICNLTHAALEADDKIALLQGDAEVDVYVTDSVYGDPIASDLLATISCFVRSSFTD